MKRFLTTALAGFFMLAGCNNNNTTSSPPGIFAACSTYSGSAPSGSNYLTVQVAPTSVCGQNGYINEPCTSVTICGASGSPCQTITDILVDTGSYGLRVYGSVLSSSLLAALTPVTHSGSDVAECATFGTANEWGPVEKGMVQLGSETTSKAVSIQIINSTYATVPSTCQSPAPGAGPSDDGFNGILGVGLFDQDCGTTCMTAGNGVYYACNGSICTSVGVGMNDQVSNPIASLPTDYQGGVLEMPAVSTVGAATATGYFILGIGTQADNTPSGTTTFYASTSSGEPTISVSYGGQSYSGFLDSGSNGLFFPGNTLAVCANGSQAEGFFCPSSAYSGSALNAGTSGSPAGVNFQVANALDLLSTNNLAFSNIAGDDSSEFDWGLPFFLGCKVYLGMEGTVTSPYWAY